MITCNLIKKSMKKHQSKTIPSPIIPHLNLYRKNINSPHQFPLSSKDVQRISSRNYLCRTVQAHSRANACSCRIASSNKDHRRYSSTWNHQNHSTCTNNNPKTPPVKACISDKKSFISNPFFNLSKVSSWILNDCINTTFTTITISISEKSILLSSKFYLIYDQ